MDGSQRSSVEKNNMDTAIVITRMMHTNESEPYIFCVVYKTVTSKTHIVAIHNFTIGTLKIQHVSITESSSGRKHQSDILKRELK
jgi:hypothetical protein